MSSAACPSGPVETPILTLAQEPPKPRTSWGQTLIGLLAGGFIGYAGGHAVKGGVDILLWFPLFYLAIAVHELGHLAAAYCVGMKPGGLVIGGLMIFRSGPRWVFRFDIRRLLSGGLAKPLPEKGEFDRVRYAWMVA